MSEYQCPCCKYFTLAELPGHYEICPVCYWEDDPIQGDNDNYIGGANDISLKEARKNFLKCGSSNLKYMKFVRPPKGNEFLNLD
jgi:hypothetical protein